MLQINGGRNVSNILSSNSSAFSRHISLSMVDVEVPLGAEFFGLFAKGLLACSSSSKSISN